MTSAETGGSHAVDLPVTAADVSAARRRLASVANLTPVLTCAALDDLVGAPTFVKVEALQRSGAFKFRGAYNCVAQLDAQSAGKGVAATSSGNHAQALALSASLCGVRAVVAMPQDAPEEKRSAAASYGAEVRTYDRYTADRDEIAADLATEGFTVVPSSDDARVIAGAATVAAELIEQAGGLDLVLVPTGGGGLLSGSAVACRAAGGSTRVIGVEPEASDDVQQSLRSGSIQTVAVAQTIADGQQIARPGRLPFAIIRQLVEDVVTVTDAEIVGAMRFLFERMKLVVEPSGASAVAALLAGRIPVGGTTSVGVVVSGGNIGWRRFSSLLADPVPSGAR